MTVQNMMCQKELRTGDKLGAETYCFRSLSEEKETIAKCILDLKLLPRKAQMHQSVNASISIETVTNS